MLNGKNTGWLGAFAIATGLAAAPAAAQDARMPDPALTQRVIDRAVSASPLLESASEQSETTPVVVSLGASWCGPCIVLKRAYNEVLSGSPGLFTLDEIDTDTPAGGAALTSLGQTAIPVTFLLCRGQMMGQWAGISDAVTGPVRIITEEPACQF